MKPQYRLLEQLIAYSNSDAYPFHMPGHKRREFPFPNPYSIDITEIDGFDNLHYPEGILKDSMDWAASVYGAEKTYYLINGSSGGILSGICAATNNGGKILISRNCHKSAYHGVILNRLKTAYVYPQMIESLGIQGGISVKDVEKCLTEHPDIQAVLIVSPTYDGMVSDIGAIAKAVHKRGLPLIVDEAHGAHFSFGQEGGFPCSALSLGADLVIQSLHKTLPSFTQTALLHLKSDYISREKLERYLGMFQSSSPSYVLLAGIERCIWEMEQGKTKQMSRFAARLEVLRQELNQLQYLKLAGKALCGKYQVFDVDQSKIVISANGCMRQEDGCPVPADGAWMAAYLRDFHCLEMEMSGADYVVAITTYLDTTEGLARLRDGLLAMDMLLMKSCPESDALMALHNEKQEFERVPDIRMTLAEAMETEYEPVLLEESSGRIAAEFVYLYPPGIPLVAPGELVTDIMIAAVKRYLAYGLPVQGMADRNRETLQVIKDSGTKKG